MADPSGADDDAHSLRGIALLASIEHGRVRVAWWGRWWSEDSVGISLLTSLMRRVHSRGWIWIWTGSWLTVDETSSMLLLSIINTLHSQGEAPLLHTN